MDTFFWIFNRHGYPKHLELNQRSAHTAAHGDTTSYHRSVPLYLSTTTRSAREAPRYAARGSLQQDPVADDDDATADATRQFHLPSAQLELHETRTPTRTTQHARGHNHETGPPRASAHAHIGGRPENNGESTSPEAKHVTRSETRHRKQTNFRMAHSDSTTCV